MLVIELVNLSSIIGINCVYLGSVVGIKSIYLSSMVSIECIYLVEMFSVKIGNELSMLNQSSLSKCVQLLDVCTTVSIVTVKSGNLRVFHGHLLIMTNL